MANVTAGNDTMYGGSPVSPGPTAIVITNANGATGFTVQTLTNTSGVTGICVFIRQYTKQGGLLRGNPMLNSAYDGLCTYAPPSAGPWPNQNPNAVPPQPWLALPSMQTTFPFSPGVTQYTIIPQSSVDGGGTDNWQTAAVTVAPYGNSPNTYQASFAIGSDSVSVVITMQEPSR
jgi:hypothetical protein